MSRETEVDATSWSKKYSKKDNIMRHENGFSQPFFLIVTPGAVDFLRARPSVKHRSMSEIARFQPCFRIWRPVSMLPRKSFLRPARFALAPKPRPRPESRDSPGITAKQRETSPGGGDKSRASRDARMVEGKSSVREIPHYPP